MSVPTNWDSAGQGIQAEIDALGPLVSSTSTSLPSVSSADISGKVMLIKIAGISGAAGINVKVNGTTFLPLSVSGAGVSFCISFECEWDSTNGVLSQNLAHTSLFTAVSASAPLTFSIDASHTVTEFSLSV